MNNVNTNVFGSQYGVDNVPVNVAYSEEGDNPDIITFLNSQTRELNLDLDPNDFSPQTLFTNYHLEDDIISLSHSIPNQLFISHFNIRSLNKNFDQFHLLINQLKFDYGIIGC